MAFSIDCRGQARARFAFTVRRQSDGAFWSFSSGWTDETTYNLLPELAPGYYGHWLTATTRGDCYEVAIRAQRTGDLVRHYVCDSKGKKPVGTKGESVNATIIQGTLYVDGKPETPGVILDKMSSNGNVKYTAIKWTPSGITSCNCPGWTYAGKNKGKGVTQRSCKHTLEVSRMTASVRLVDSILPQTQALPAAGNTQRSGRGIELD